MRKEDMVGLPVESPPTDLFSLISKLSDLFFLWTFRHGFLMAFEAGGEVRRASECLGFVEPVAMVAVQSLGHVLLVIERDRLLDPGSRSQTDQDKE
jgi:maltodextrin utilization protein YvdJ